MKRNIFLVLSVFFTLAVFGQDFEVPEDYKLEEKEDYQLYEPQILAAIDWSLNTPLDKDAQKRKEVYAFFFTWAIGSPDVSIMMDDDVSKFTESNRDLMMIFMMGWTKYALDNQHSKDNVKCYKAGIEAVVTFYENNKTFLKKEKGLEKYEKLIKKGKLEGELRKKSFLKNNFQ